MNECNPCHAHKAELWDPDAAELLPLAIGGAGVDIGGVDIGGAGVFIVAELHTRYATL